MHLLKLRKGLLLVPLALLVLLALSMAHNFVVAGPSANNQDDVFALQAPSFVNTAHAASINGLNDVGIAAYIDTGETIDLADVRGTYEVIEDETATYIIGSVAVPEYGDQQDEAFHTHVYVSVDGWLLAYYMDSDPASKIVDWKDYVNSSGGSMPTLFEKVLAKVASDAGVAYDPPTYYDFRFPNATHMMLIGDFTEPNNYDQFSVELPSANTYYETSWGLYRNYNACCSNSYWNIDETTVSGSSVCKFCIGYGMVQVSPDTEHWIGLNYSGGLVIVYREGS